MTVTTEDNVAEGGPWPLAGLRVLESGDATIDYCGLLLAGLGAEVLKLEPPEGSESRLIGPFLPDQQSRQEASLFHRAYNRSKGSVVLDPDQDFDVVRLVGLAASADVWIHGGHPHDAAPFLGLNMTEIRDRNPKLITAHLTPFGESGPWAHFRGGDLVQLALGGVIMNCGYDADWHDRYDTAPVWPQSFHSLHIAGEQLAMGVLGALVWRDRSGLGQVLHCAIHEAVSKATEVDLMSWVMLHTPFHRQTCRHSGPDPSAPTIAQSKDGRWMCSMTLSGVDRQRLRRYLFEQGIGEETQEGGAPVATARNVPGTGRSLTEDSQRDIELVQRLTRRSLYEDLPWKEGQDAGLLWAPLRKPHENALDEHWLSRGTFADLWDGEKPTRYPISKWRSSTSGWKAGSIAPTLGDSPCAWKSPAVARTEGAPKVGTVGNGHAWALDGIRIFDFSWFLASAGGTRFLAAMGADCIKVEWSEHPDTRLGAGAPEGGRPARDRATGALTPTSDPDMGGNFNHKNAGKRGISLNVRHPEGLRIAKALVAKSDVVAEGFSPGVLDRWGLGYEVLRSLRPDIIYAQQSGMGAAGTYGRTRAVGPIAAALAGVSEMSGFPDPVPPAGWGYSYLDWLAAYSFASSILVALYERSRTGEGQYIDASQCEVGIFASVLPIVEWSTTGRIWERTGNRSPYQLAAPEGVYRCRGEDRWIAISCGTDEQWIELLNVMNRFDLREDARFVHIEQRLANRQELDAIVQEWTRTQEPYELMEALQATRVPAGVCQTAEDRCDNDPQLAALGWMSEVTGTKIGSWPVGEFPVRMEATPPFIGGQMNRGAPCYGEDNYAVYEELLGLSHKEVDRLRDEGVV